MKIAVVQDFLRSGGTERQAVLLANAFAGAGHETTLLTFRPGGPLARTISADVPHRSLQPFDLKADWFAPGLRRRLRAMAPEVVLCMGRMANCYAGGMQAELPESIVFATMRTGKPLPDRYLRSLHAVRHIVANSREARTNLIQAYFVDPGKISIIHNSLVFPADPTDAIEGPPTRARLREQWGAGPATTVLLSVAMFRPEKNQRELIELAAGLPAGLDWQLWLAGDGPERAACTQLAASRGLADRVKFPGFHANPKPLYFAADVAVHASASEALSNFLIEAQAHGLPAVAYEAQGIEECFMPGRTGWMIERGNRQAFRQELARLCAALPTVRDRLAEAARGHARCYFEPRRQMYAYLDLFSLLLRQPTDRQRMLRPS
jgi:glycosyltransferase involved in cell wall biosynthesis